MTQSLAQVALVVRDYDEAIEFYVNTLGFALIEDTAVPEQSKRWVVVAPPGDRDWDAGRGIRAGRHGGNAGGHNEVAVAGNDHGV